MRTKHKPTFVSNYIFDKTRVLPNTPKFLIKLYLKVDQDAFKNRRFIIKLYSSVT